MMIVERNTKGYRIDVLSIGWEMGVMGERNVIHPSILSVISSHNNNS